MEKIRLCFVSRVEQSKGLDTIKRITSILDEIGMSDKVTIDFFGQKTDCYFDSYLSDICICNYRGVLQPQEVIHTLQKYDALLFPTHYDGEGCPGILVESLSASLPIIASDWKYNCEFVTNGINGFLCDTYNSDAYVKAILAIADPILKKQMKKQSYLKSKDFAVTSARRKIKYLI
ncbi:MAG: glycosyltransferase [Candidatus Cryptobacteroides sp.]